MKCKLKQSNIEIVMMLRETNGVQTEGFIQTSIWLENFAHLWELHPFCFLHCISILKLNTNRSLMDRLMLCQTYICAFHSTQNVTEKWNHGLPIKLMIHSFLNSNLKALPQPMPQTHWVSPRLVTMLQPSEVRKEIRMELRGEQRIFGLVLIQAGYKFDTIHDVTFKLLRFLARPAHPAWG